MDGEHLRLLALFHYVSGAVTLAFSLFFGIGIVIAGAMFAFLPPVPAGSAEAVAPPVHGPPTIAFVVMGVLFVLGLSYGILEIISGRCIARRRRRLVTLAVAIPRMLFIPYGVILSLFTLLVLERSSVKQLYRESSGA